MIDEFYNFFLGDKMSTFSKKTFPLTDELQITVTYKVLDNNYVKWYTQITQIPDKLTQLKSELDEAVKQEEFEKAANLLIEIKELQK